MRAKSIYSIILILLITIFTTSVYAVENLKWVSGGTKVDVGDRLATFKVPDQLAYLNKEDTITVQKQFGNSASSREIASVYPTSDQENWYVVIEYDEVGHIMDDEQNNIDKDAILKSYKEGTEEHNKERKPEEQIHVVGWDVPPSYNAKTHTLQWSMLAEDNQKNPIINYNLRLLTRKGYVSFILVSDPATLAKDKKILTEQILPQFQLKEGNRYSDYDASTDKLADYGLTGLVLGGLGLAVAKKVGFLALILIFLKKAWIVVVLVLGGIFKVVSNIFKKKKDHTLETSNDSQAETNPNSSSEKSPTVDSNESSVPSNQTDSTSSSNDNSKTM
ncbi:DUF2167 domain-containing protein [Brevibacillus laterosporus]|uniref:DUF2167 domain-containing protein n=1 Tax=Brevibacillus laterosporus TaxID=1465 RepID=UPI000372DD02|nr:DUF2167 domain-containing protein [Brevibacillus laterosporus]ATO51539.1 membrane-anchored protein [Brevibacillus laterosporus DSM 25]AYB38127.1 DUF2167 domain-containing protein [Brevibacillus laterosporus]MBG9774952.1 membrane-anchored protein [Brevibacillus laterosporus]MBG9805056.1 membrane-anchored protein [Brevibacillus laterosporus]MBM7110294.1 hypothetical protein [Brevibacillus laterosporus]